MDIQEVGLWEIDKKLGAGGMGTVYLGKHKETGQVAAIKVLPPSLAREEGFVERFKREIDSMEKLKSPHIVEFFESGNDGDTYYYAMEYVDGETLTARLKRDKRMPWPEVIDLCLQICRALKAAHNSGIIHRDLKPSNLMIASDGTMKLTDFGVAQVFASQKLTVTGGIVGTAEYMSPEQAKGQRATKKSDLYSLGAVMYVMLTGRPPFSGKSSLDVIHKHQFANFDRPSLIATDMPRQLEEIVCKLLEKDPDNRYPDSYVLSLRLAEVQKRYAWQTAQKAAEAAAASGSATPSTANIADATEASEHARADDDAPLAPTVLIPDALGQHVPPGPTLVTPGKPVVSSQSPALGATLTSPSSQRSGTASDATRHMAPPSQGPGTIMRNLMRKALTEQQQGGALGQALDKTWVQIAGLLLLIIGGVWWFNFAKRSAQERYDNAMKIMNQPANSEWGYAKETFEELLKEDHETWQEKVELQLRKIQVYENRRKYKTSRSKVAGTSSEPQRLMQLALEYLKLGEVGIAERKLEALLDLTADQEDLKSLHSEARDLLNNLRDDRAERAVTAWLKAKLNRAEKLAADGKVAEARDIWRAIVELYADDPDPNAAEQVAEARRNLQATSETSATAKTSPKESSKPESDSPSKAESQ